jgi:hypothetical protein
MAGVGERTRIRHIVQQPFQLEAAEIAGQRQTGERAESVLATLTRKISHQRIDTRVLPHQRVVQRLTGATIPNHRRLTLVGDTDRNQILDSELRRLQRLGDHRLSVARNIQRRVLNPARLREDLRMLLLSAGDDAAGVIEHDETCAGGSLIDRADKGVHIEPRCYLGN